MPTTEQSHQEPGDQLVNLVTPNEAREDMKDAFDIAMHEIDKAERELIGHAPVRVGDWVYWWEKRTGPQLPEHLPLRAEPCPGLVVHIHAVKQGSGLEPNVDLFVAKDGQWMIVTDKARAEEPTHGFWCWKD